MYSLTKTSPILLMLTLTLRLTKKVQTVPAAEVKSVPVLARPSDDTEDPGDTPNNENNDSPVVVSEPGDSQQATTAPIPRRSSRISRPPRPFWIAPTDSATLALSALTLPRTNALSPLMCLNPTKRQHRMVMLTYGYLPYKKRNLQFNVTRPGIS